MLTFKDTVSVRRVSGFDSSGTEVFLPAFHVKSAIWRRRRKAIIGGEGGGEQVDIVAQGFMSTQTTSGVTFRPMLRDRLVVSAHGFETKYEVRQVILGETEQGVLDHWGVELSEDAM